MGDGFYRSKHPTNSIKVLKEKLRRKNQKRQTTKYRVGQKMAQFMLSLTLSK